MSAAVERDATAALFRPAGRPSIMEKRLSMNTFDARQDVVVVVVSDSFAADDGERKVARSIVRSLHGCCRRFRLAPL